MPATVVVETGAGLATANAYATTAAVEAQLQQLKDYDTTWALLTADQKGYAVIDATTYLDTNFRFYGQPLYQDQALCWPRTRNYDAKGFLIEPGLVPAQLVKALALMSQEWARSTTGLTAVQSSSGPVQSWSADGVSISFDTQAQATSGEAGVDSNPTLLGVRIPQVEFLLRSIGVRKDQTFLESNRVTERIA